MLLERVVLFFPAVEVFVAQEAADVVRVGWLRVEEETGACELSG